MMTVSYGVKRALALAAASAVTASCALNVCASEEPDFNVETNAPPHVVFLGDSITAGYKLEGYSVENNLDCASFANILATVFDSELPPQADFSMLNFGENGLTSRGLLKKLRSGELDDPLRDADAVVISIGGNDMLHTFMSLLSESNNLADTIGKALDLSNDLDRDLEGFADNLPEIAEELHDRTDGRIFIQTLYNPMEETDISKINSMSEEKIGRLNEIITECSEDGNAYVVVDVAEQFKGRSKELTNIEDMDIHPNALGHAVMADVLHDAIEEYSYSYYDAEAAMQYELDQEAERQKEREDKEKRTRTLVICSGAGAAVLLSAVTFAAVRRKKSRQ